ncbi:MAG: hypothetical protein IK088_07380 [Lachnospiraceae bacterium]|nr:hypothetical protein [Lachnospiraceae bacterium]
MKKYVCTFLTALLLGALISGCTCNPASVDPTKSGDDPSAVVIDEPTVEPDTRTPDTVIPKDLPEGEWVKTVFVYNTLLSAKEELMFSRVMAKIDPTEDLTDNWNFFAEETGESAPTIVTEAPPEEKYSHLYKAVTVIAQNVQKEYTDLAYLVSVTPGQVDKSYWAIMTIRNTDGINAEFRSLREIDIKDIKVTADLPDEQDPDCYFATEELTRMNMILPQVTEPMNKAVEAYEPALIDPLSLIGVRTENGIMQYNVISRAVMRTRHAETVIMVVTLTVEEDGTAFISDADMIDLDYYTALSDK